MRFLLACLAALTTPAAWSQALQVTIEPPGTNVVAGTDVTFCAAISGSGPFTLQWQKNGFNLVDQTNLCLVVTAVAIADGGNYRVLALHPGGDVASGEALLAVALTPTPGGDAFAAATEVFALSNSVQGDNSAASRETGEPVHAGLSTSNSVWYAWRAPLSGIATFDTRGSAFDTVLAVYTGEDLNQLQPVAGDDDSGGFHTSLVRWNAEEGTLYLIAIDSLAAEVGAYHCNWDLEFTAERVPVIVAPPADQTVTEGAAAAFSVTVSDPDPYLAYVWYHNGMAIAGANGPTLNLSIVGRADLGSYVLAVTNSSGRGAVSRAAVLEIGPVAAVQSRDKVAELSADAGGGGSGGTAALTGGFGGSFSLAAGTTINHQFLIQGSKDRCEPPHCHVAGGASRWFQLAAASDGICALDTLGSDTDTVLAVYVQNFSICTNLFTPLVGCNNDRIGACDSLMGPPETWNRASGFSFLATSNSIYRVVIDTVGGITGAAVQFNVVFQAEAAQPAPVFLDQTQRGILQRRGAPLGLAVDPALQASGDSYQWLSNGRPVAGATRQTLLLPNLDFSDAARYAVTIRNGSETVTLPGVAVAVVEPCRSLAFGDDPARLFWWGATGEPALLEWTDALTDEPAWLPLGPFPVSAAPMLWITTEGERGFYRWAGEAP